MIFNLNLENINYLKIIYKDKNDTTRCAKAAIKKMNEFDIIACTKLENGFNLRTPQDISLSFICENGLYRTTTSLKYIDIKDEYVFFTIKSPVGLDYQQNREYFRVRMEVPVTILYERYGISKKLTGVTYDISANGVRLSFDKVEEISNDVEIIFLFENKIIATKAQLIRMDTDVKIYDAAFKFVDLKSNDMDFISQLCIKTQLEYKRNSIK